MMDTINLNPYYIYTPRLPLKDQVRQSLATLLQTVYIDSLVFHATEQSHNLAMEVYCEYEKFVDVGRAKQLGISNLYNPND
ncbi:unnamed protein product [Rotaria sp. Silwood2]|nr:unnamed protein product [Rotaria sp. Silwood2]CAF2521145.1 unnamed protein product [Rotaria sp. Silwood2]CAF3995814.1 unnamed protein product [Rotaria sp. Silwood2]CAF4403618.1 unnamed protein product [Rotaria sp. Silwood2]